jgi:uncharacterized protein YuzE
MRRNNVKITYDAKADVLTLEQPKGVIDHATEMGNLVVHFSKRREPVLIEVLEASQIFKRNRKSFSSALASAR